MPGNQRIRGEQVEVLIISARTPESGVTDVRSLEFTFKMEIKEEGYLGETTMRHDEIFNGISGKIDIHFEDEGVFTMIQKILDKAQRRNIEAAQVKFNVKATLNFPNGDTPRVIFPDVHWGEIPVNFGSRADYGMISLPFACDNCKVITA